MLVGRTHFIKRQENEDNCQVLYSCKYLCGANKSRVDMLVKMFPEVGPIGSIWKPKLVTAISAKDSSCSSLEIQRVFKESNQGSEFQRMLTFSSYDTWRIDELSFDANHNTNVQNKSIKLKMYKTIQKNILPTIIRG